MIGGLQDGTRKSNAIKKIKFGLNSQVLEKKKPA
jgi:hypothetical protein